jgi:hypothetical protein
MISQPEAGPSRKGAAAVQQRGLVRERAAAAGRAGLPRTRALLPLRLRLRRRLCDDQGRCERDTRKNAGEGTDHGAARSIANGARQDVLEPRRRRQVRDLALPYPPDLSCFGADLRLARDPARRVRDDDDMAPDPARVIPLDDFDRSHGPDQPCLNTDLFTQFPQAASPRLSPVSTRPPAA